MRSPTLPLPDRYRPTGFLAAGGMAGVWSAHDERLDRDVAIKLLAEHLSEDADAARRFQREARAAAALSSHPHVVTIYDVGEHSGRAYIVMELLRGGSVAERIAEGRVARRTALQWITDAAQALDAAHERGIVHRDVKPGNLLLDDRGRLAVADFGIARLVTETQHTASGLVLGTAAYLSPEQAAGESATAASDRYALAVVAFELLTGQRPFRHEHFAAQARAHIEEQPPRATSLDPLLPAALDAVLARGMAKDARDRWPTAAGFAAALGRALREPATEATVRQVAWRPRRPPAVLAPVLALTALLGIVLAVVLGGAGGDDGGRTTTTGDRAARKTQTRSTTPHERKRRTQSEPSRQAAPQPTATATSQPTAEPSGGDPAELNDAGYRLLQSGRFDAAIPLLQRAVTACGDSPALDPCGYAYFNLGAALNRVGRRAEAIPILQQRLQRWKFKKGEVKRELKAAARGH